MSSYDNYNSNQQQYPGYNNSSPYPPQQQQPYYGQQQQPGFNGQQQYYGQNPAVASGYSYPQQMQQQQPPPYSASTSSAYTVPVNMDGGAKADGGWYTAGGAGKQEPEDNMAASFSDKAVRTAFIRKVYAILMLQLVITGCIMAVIMFVEPVKE